MRMSHIYAEMTSQGPYSSETDAHMYAEANTFLHNLCWLKFRNNRIIMIIFSNAAALSPAA